MCRERNKLNDDGELKSFETFPVSKRIYIKCVRCRTKLKVVGSYESTDDYISLQVDTEHDCEPSWEHQPSVSWHSKSIRHYFPDEYFKKHYGVKQPICPNCDADKNQLGYNNNRKCEFCGEAYEFDKEKGVIKDY